MTAIVFGAGGQDGFYLTKLLEELGITVIGIDRLGSSTEINITDFKQVATLVGSTKPDYIFHFAANSTTHHSTWIENHETIVTGTLVILEAVREFSPGTKIFLSGSGLQFQNTGQPISESDLFEASSMYAVSRIQMVYAARYYRTLGIKVYVGYFFNHDSPLRTERHINKKIAFAAQRIASGSNEKLAIGDLNVMKEFGFAGDIVKALWTLVQQHSVFEAVIGTGKAHSIREWVELCFGLFGLDWNDHIEKATDFVSPYKILVSNPSTIFSLGWRPQTEILELAKMMSRQ